MQWKGKRSYFLLWLRVNPIFRHFNALDSTGFFCDSLQVLEGKTMQQSIAPKPAESNAALAAWSEEYQLCCRIISDQLVVLQRLSEVVQRTIPLQPLRCDAATNTAVESDCPSHSRTPIDETVRMCPLRSLDEIAHLGVLSRLKAHQRAVRQDAFEAEIGFR